MEVVLAIALAITAWAIVYAWAERYRVQSHERIEMARMATDELVERVRRLEKTSADHEHALGKVANQMEILRASQGKPPRPITGLRS